MHLSRCLAVLAFASFCRCGALPPAGPPPDAAADAGAHATDDAGTDDAGTADAGTVDAGTADAGADAGAVSPSPDAGAPQSYTCTQVNGAAQSVSWFIDGIFAARVGAGRWQRLGGTGVNHWRAPFDAVWSEPLEQPCAQGSAAPDRVVQVVWGHTTFTVDEWVSRLREVLTVIRGKYPGVKKIVLQPVAWLEGCVGSNASDQNARILDAIARVAGGDVEAGPNLKLLSCTEIQGLSLDRLTPAAARRVAAEHAAFFAP